jgi:tetratricopeptide (TPR) repeat protein
MPDATNRETIPQAVPAQGIGDPTLPLVPGYEVRTELARGGMGVVYAARDLALGREVAIKIILHNSSPRALDRFATEAKITANLAHPAIPPVHQLGTLADGSPFLAMKLIRGRTLADELAARPSPSTDLPRFVQVFEQVCQAVGFAHSRGVIHRDIKPLNVMVGQFGEVQVMDWGLARKDEPGARRQQPEEDRPRVDSFFIDHSATARTAAGSVMGTPSYMPPEQARGDWDAVDCRADVFALGAVLCDILTGKPAYTGTTDRAVWLRACEAELSDAYSRLGACGADAELVALARHCLSPQPEDRPADGKAVADAVAAYRTGVEERLRVAERQRAVAEAKAVEQRKRRKVQLALAGAVALLVFGAGATAWWLDIQAEERRRAAADAEATRARLEADQARIAGELAAAQARAEAGSRIQQEQTRIRVAALLNLAVELRKNYRFREAKSMLETAGREADASGAAELKALVDGAATNLAFVTKLHEIRLDKLRPEKGKWSANRSPAQFRECFREFGFDVVGGNLDELARRLRESPVKDSLIDALDQWGLEDREPAIRRRIWDLTATATGQEWRKLVLGARDRVETTEAVLAKIPREELTPSLIGSLGFYLFTAGGNGIRLMEQGLIRFPGDFWLHYYLSTLYSYTPGRQADALGHLRSALAIRPGDAVLWMNLANQLAARGDEQAAEEARQVARSLDPNQPSADKKDASVFGFLGDVTPDEVIRLTDDLLRANPKFAAAHAARALGLLQKGDIAGAEKSSREALKLDPKTLGWIHHQVGLAWNKQGDRESAMRCYREVVRDFPDFSLAHDAIGVALVEHNDLAGALLEFQEAVRLDPRNGVTRAHLADCLARTGRGPEALLVARDAVRLQPNDSYVQATVGSTLYFAGDGDGALAAFREAVALDPKNAHAYDWLGYALLNVKGDAAGAVVAAEQAVKLDPKRAQHRRNLGLARLALGDKERGFEDLREAVKLEPLTPEFHRALGHAMVNEGRFAEGLPHLRRWDELLVKVPGAPDVSAQWVRDCEAVVRAQPRLPDVLAGKAQPADAAERLALARVCLLKTRQYPEAVRFFREAFAQDKKLVADAMTTVRYSGARAAGFAAGDPATPAGDRAGHRAQAAEWLRADFEQIKFGIAVRRLNPVGQGHVMMKQWLAERAFAPLRHPFYLATLPPDEAKQYRKLWDDVRQLRDKHDPRPAIAPPPREVRR